ncbi:MAG: 50S ribosomal protein L13 [Paenibacillaceae bacterium]|nr:50S ribosomal protein L13 [Paenibacillaceae bacterium]
MRTTYMAKTNEVQRDWWIVDAAGKTLGRISSEIAMLLRGKHKPHFTPHTDTGDFVIVINAGKIVLTGKKLQQKKYYSHSGYMSGLRVKTAQQMRDHRPVRMIEHAVYGMLPKTKLGNALKTKLKVYAGDTHPHEAQQPVVYDGVHCLATRPVQLVRRDHPEVASETEQGEQQ